MKQGPSLTAWFLPLFSSLNVPHVLFSRVEYTVPPILSLSINDMGCIAVRVEGAVTDTDDESQVVYFNARGASFNVF